MIGYRNVQVEIGCRRCRNLRANLLIHNRHGNARVGSCRRTQGQQENITGRSYKPCARRSRRRLSLRLAQGAERLGWGSVLEGLGRRFLLVYLVALSCPELVPGALSAPKQSSGDMSHIGIAVGEDFGLVALDAIGFGAGTMPSFGNREKDAEALFCFSISVPKSFSSI